MPGESRAGVEEPVYKELLLLVCYGLTTPPESVRRGASAINPAGRQAGIPWVAFLSTRSSPEVGPQAPLIRGTVLIYGLSTSVSSFSSLRLSTAWRPCGMRAAHLRNRMRTRYLYSRPGVEKVTILIIYG